MIESKSNPIGIDAEIDRIQKHVHDPLVEAFGETVVYGRVYKVVKKDRVELQIYTGNYDYRSVLSKEGNKVFFIQGDSPDLSRGQATNDLWMVCILKIDSKEQRNDEEAHVEVMTALSTNFLSKVSGMEYGMENLRRVTEDSLTSNFKYSDIHPYHVFMVKMNVEYSLIKDNC
jgi:hypothetical protein